MKVRLIAIAGLLAASGLSVSAATLVENFTNNPAADGWRVFGDTSLFSWNSTNQSLDVTWDSTRPNSYFFLPIGKTLTTNDSFCVQFDLQINDAASFGYGMDLAIGLLHEADATNANFSRAGAYTSPNIFEFDYYPAVTTGDWPTPDTVSASIVDAAANYRWNADSRTLASNVTYQVTLLHFAGSLGISGVISTNGRLMSAFPLANNYYPANDSGAFQLDTLAVINYADDGYGDSVLAHGSVRKIAVAAPLPVDMLQSPVAGQVWFASDSNWLYTMEKSSDLQNWSPAALPIFGNGTNLVLSATNPPADKMFYRVRADLP
jgi:hypothetical protein